MTKQEELKKLFAENSILSASAIRSANIPTSLVTRLVRSGEADRIGRGLYSSTHVVLSETSDYEIIARLVPHGVFSLASALRFHNLTDENPHSLSMSIEHGKYYPHIDYPPVKFYTSSKNIFSFDIETHRRNGTDIKVYSVVKTIADCFKYRNKIGLDIAIAALREASQKKNIDYNKLWQAAKVCRVTKIIRPYMEAMQ